MARSKRRKPMSEINMVPFIDIMMVMLVAFMVSAPMLTQGVNVELPKVSSKPIPLSEEAKTLIISVKSDGHYFIDLGKNQSQATELKTINERVKKVVAASPQTKVLIKGDKEVSYGTVVELMAGLQGAGVSNVGLITSPSDLNNNEEQGR